MNPTLFDSDVYVEPREKVTIEFTLHLQAGNNSVSYGYVIYDTETRDWLAAEVPGIISDSRSELALGDEIWMALRRAESFLATF
jgi:hypothetical protein